MYVRYAEINKLLILVGVFLESTTDFTVDARAVTNTGDGKVKSFVTAPSGTRTEALVNNNNDGTYKCMYTPFEQGMFSFVLYCCMRQG